MTTAVGADRGTIRVSSLTKMYPGPDRDLKVLDEVSVAAERGSCIALRGVSGSGKSTLLNILGGIEEFDSGEVEVSGVDLGSLPRRQRSGFRATTIGFIFQFFNLLPTLTAVENVSAALELLGKVAAERRERALVMLARLVLGTWPITSPSKCPAGSSSVSRSPGRWLNGPR